MNVSELRLGNLVYDDEGLMCTIERVSSKDFIHWDGAIGDYAIIGRVVGTYDDYRCVEGDKWIPIPLTEELLLKCGFEKKSYVTSGVEIEIFFYQIGNIIVYLMRDFYEIEIITSSGQFNLRKTFPKHLHQLQNLYNSLTGQELEIKK